ncbi:MAG: MFS transporter [Rhodospirillales bacterium]|nr:MFS transporter [Rhodospirillales bacterium]
MPKSNPESTFGISSRLALFYAAIFALIGVHMPFWPVWLTAKGLGPVEIGIIIAAGVGTKVIFNPIIAHMADKGGQRRPIMIGLSVTAFFIFALFGVTGDFWTILLVTVMFFAVWSPIMPLGESLTMLTGHGSEKAKELDYGRIRLWGSLAFMATAIGAGHLISGRSPDIIYWIILLGLAFTVAAVWALPATRAPKTTGSRFASLDVLRDRRFVLFITACALIQASHGVYYGFGTLNWQAQGYSDTVIGWLWAEGVAAEIILFIFGTLLVNRFGSVALIAMGGLAGAARWFLTGMFDDLGVLVLLQALHAFTFAATHLGAIYFITRRMPASVSASAQSLYSAMVMGLALGLSALASGKLFSLYGAGAYLPMAAMAAAGGIIALSLVKRR